MKMADTKIDLKDRKILYELDLNCRQSNSQIGKKVGLTRDVVAYRIKRMEDEGVIKGYWTAINTFKLGYNVFRIYINFQYVSTEKRKEIIQHFVNYKNAWAVISIKGEIDFDALRPFLEKDIPLVMELRSGTPDSEITEGLRFIRDLMESFQKQTSKDTGKID